MKKIIYIYLILFIPMTYSKSLSDYMINNNSIVNINTNFRSSFSRSNLSNQTINLN